MRRFRGKKKVVIVILSLIICVILGGGVFTYASLATIKTNSSSINVEALKPSSKGAVNFLITGVDVGNAEDNGDNAAQRSDTILVVHYDPSDKSLGVLSIPRDTKIKFNGRNEKINSALPEGGAKSLVNVVQDMLGIQINYYMQVDYAAFRSIIDALGGIDVNIQNKMDYDDTAQNLHIHFTPGMQHLNGEKAEEFFRWRKNNNGTGLAEGDLGRIKLQHEFMDQVMQKLKRKTTLIKLPLILREIAKNTKTNMSASEIIGYGKDMLFIKKDKISMSTLSGSPMYIGGISYFVYNPNGSKGLFKNNDTSSPSTTSTVDISKYKVEVLNGTDTNGLAKKYKDKLTALGFSNITTGNAPRKPVTQTKATLYGISEGDAAAVKSKLNLENVDLINSSPEKYDIIVVLGEDYKQ